MAIENDLAELTRQVQAIDRQLKVYERWFDVTAGSLTMPGAITGNPVQGDIRTDGGVHVGGDSDPGDGNLAVDGLITAGSAVDVNGTQVLKLNTSRAWVLVQRGTGASTRLQLQTLTDAKIFEIASMDGTKRVAMFLASNTAGNNLVDLVIDGGTVKIGGKTLVFGANDSAGAGYRTVTIQNA